jgi:Flp pilus assembly protein TadD
VFAALRHADFLSFDDASYIIDNPNVAVGLTWRSLAWAWTELGEGYWPVTWMSFLLDRQLYGLSGGAFHVTNVVVHTLNVCFLFLVLRRMTLSQWRSAWVAAVFAIHPLHVEPVAWVAERNDLLCTTFWLAGIWGYVRYVERPRLKRYLVVVLAYALGLLCKPIIITMPIGLILLDFWPLRRVRFGTAKATQPGNQQQTTLAGAFWEKVPLFVMAVAAAAFTFALRLRVGAIASLTAIPLHERIANGLVSYVIYLFKMVWPTNLAVLYPHALTTPLWLTVGAALGLCATSLLVWRMRHRLPFLLFGWLWYVITLLPVIGIVQAGPQARADRYTYVSLIGIAVAVAWSAAELTQRSAVLRRGLILTACAFLAANAVIAARAVGYWHDTETLFRRAIAVTSDNAIAHAVLGSALRDSGRIEEALPEFREAIRIDPTLYTAHGGLGDALLALGRPAEALPELARAAQLQPGQSSTHVGLASGLSRAGLWDEAVKEYRVALAIWPGNADAHSGLGIILSRQGQQDEARAEFIEATRLQPGNYDAHYNLGSFLAERSETDAAIRELSVAAQLRPDLPQAHRALGAVFGATGRVQEAIAELTEAVRLAPNDALLRSNLGSVLAGVGRLDEAIAQFREAVRIRPEMPELRDNLEKALAARRGRERP